MRAIPKVQQRLWKANAFTLVELLTVIVILGLLAGLILSSLSGAKKRAQQTQCINNVRQLGIALQGFVTEYHVYPPAFVPADLRSEYPEFSFSWDYALEAAELTGQPSRLEGHYGLMENPGTEEWVGQKNENPLVNANSWKGVWHCPCAFPPPANFPANVVGKSYGYNSAGLTPPLTVKDGPLLGLGGMAWNNLGGIVSLPPVPASSVVSPSDMMAIGDRFVGNNGVVSEVGGLGRMQGVSETAGPTGYAGSTKHASARHDGKANGVFCDGHVESPTFKALFDDTTDAALRRWNRDHEPHGDLLLP